MAKKMKEQHCQEDIPGPGQYTLPPMIGCKNTDPTHWRPPCYSFGIKTPIVGFSSVKPGPADYDIKNFTRFGKSTSPSAPMSLRLDRKPLYPGPGPGMYSPENHMNAVLTRAPSYHFGRKYDRKALYPTPGPNAYSVPSAGLLGKRSPAFSILGRRQDRKGEETPGPSNYGCPPIDAVKKRSPAFTMGSRRQSKALTATPGPGAYTPVMTSILPNAPGFTFSGRANPCFKPYIQPADNEF